MSSEQEMKDHKGWKDFCENGLQVFTNGSNVTGSFQKMTKRFGKHYLAYLEAAYQAKDEMTDDEFCKINGEIPIGFLKRFKS